MAGRTGGVDPKQHCVEVAIEARLHHAHRVAGGGALLPEPAVSGVEPGAAGLSRLAPCLLVHVGEHQDLSGLGVLDHRGDESFREVGVHCLTSRPMPARSRLTPGIESSPKWKIDAANAASAPPAVIASYMWRAVPAPPDAITGRRTAALTAAVSSRS